MPVTQQTIGQAAGGIQDLQYTLPDTSAHALPSVPSCKRVKLYAPVDSSGVGTNTAPVNYGDASNQRDWLAADGSRDAYVHVDDPALIYVKGASGDVVNYRVEI
jgi:hypothetical protein